MAVVNVFQAGGDLQLRPVQAGGQRPVFPPQPLPFDQQGQPLLELQLADVRLAALFLQCLGHAFQTQCGEFFHGLMIEHNSSSSVQA